MILKPLDEISKEDIENLKDLNVPCPLLVAAVLTEMKGALVFCDFNTMRHCFPSERSPEGATREFPIDRDVVILPEIRVDEYPAEDAMLAHILRPMLDALWNACGHRCSPNFDEQGLWRQCGASP